MSQPAAAPEMTNGAAASRSFAATARDQDDPMAKVLGLDAKTTTLGAWFGFTSGGTLLLAGTMLLATYVAWLHTARDARADVPEEIEVLKEDTPPPPPPPTAEPEPEAKPAAPPPPHAAAAPPPPAPAQAAKVLTQEPDPNEPVDLTGNTIVQGNADAYGGGYTTSTGTGTGVHAPPAPSGVPGGTGPVQAPAAPSTPDRSRTAALGGGGEWSCPFPPEADTAQIDEAFVTLQVDVKADGSPGAVRVMSDPGNGFGREARRCAMGKRYATALDHDGNAIPGTTKPFRVHFSR